MKGVEHNGDEALTLLELVLRLEGEFRRSLEPIRVTPLQAGVILYLHRHPDAKLTDAASVKAPLMTGFRRSRKSSDNRTRGMLTCHIVVDTPMRSRTDSEATQPLKYHHMPHSPLVPSFATLID